MKKTMWIFLLAFSLSSLAASVAFAAEEPLGQEVKKFIGLACGLAIEAGFFPWPCYKQLINNYFMV